MPTQIDRRLAALEGRRQEDSRCKGIRYFTEDEDNAGVFYEMPGPFFTSERPYNRADISAVAALGWTTIIVVYDSPQATDAP